MRLVFLSTLLFFPFLVQAADGTLYMMPERGAYKIGEVFEVRVLADSGGVPINAVEAELNFNPHALSVEKISVEKSILSSWSTDPFFSNADGIIQFSGWTGGTFTGQDGLLVTITFKALRDASANAHLAAGAMLAVQDGSNIITSMKSGVYTVAPRDIAHPSVAQSLSTEVSGMAEIISEPAPPPLITRYEQSIAAGETIIVQGKTDPSARLTVWLQKGSEESMYYAQSDLDGSFTFTAPRPAEEGVYRIWVAADDAYGVSGPQSDRAIINVRPKGLIATIVPTTQLVSDFLPYLALIIFAGLVAGFLYHRQHMKTLAHKN